MTLKFLPSHEDIIDYTITDKAFLKKLAQLSKTTREKEVEVAFEVESGMDELQFYISYLKTGNKETAQPGRSTCPYDWQNKVRVLGIHSHPEKKGNPPTAIFSMDDLLHYMRKVAYNVSNISHATGIAEHTLFEGCNGNILHQEGIVRPTVEGISLLIYQPPLDIVKRNPEGYNLAKPINHYVGMIERIGKEGLNDQQIIVAQLRNSGYLATFLRFEANNGIKNATHTPYIQSLLSLALQSA